MDVWIRRGTSQGQHLRGFVLHFGQRGEHPHHSTSAHRSSDCDPADPQMVYECAQANGQSVWTQRFANLWGVKSKTANISLLRASPRVIAIFQHAAAKSSQ